MGIAKSLRKPKIQVKQNKTYSWTLPCEKVQCPIGERRGRGPVRRPIHGIRAARKRPHLFSLQSVFLWWKFEWTHFPRSSVPCFLFPKAGLLEKGLEVEGPASQPFTTALFPLGRRVYGWLTRIFIDLGVKTSGHQTKRQLFNSKAS